MVGDGRLLWWWVLDEFNALFDVSFEAFRAGLNELLLLLGHALKDVVGLISAARLHLPSASFAGKGKKVLFLKDAYSERNRYREEVGASRLGNSIASRDTGQIDESRFNNACLALESLNDALRKSIAY